ncbi:hypothetical protein HNY73_004210 [Argiope bruennichi]|uniref:Uncharacterized protein n=1 Tax=Argiope bruennichi TaxID=94029 RepID=A0A8T0FR30_ARGBR|nr:hypothetical protein HNY73_004210 [Argiope bruennichi]
MTASFLPSLKHMTLAKIAITICKEPEISCSIYELDYLWDKNIREGRWKRLMEKAEEKVSKLHIPPRLQQNILALIKPISLEMAKFKHDHLYFLGNRFDFQRCRLFWTHEGETKNYVPFFILKDPLLKPLLMERKLLFQETVNTNNNYSSSAKRNKINAKIKFAYTHLRQTKWRELCNKLECRILSSGKSSKRINREQPQSETCNILTNSAGQLSTDDNTAANFLGSFYQETSRVNFSYKVGLIKKKTKNIINGCRRTDLGSSQLTRRFNSIQSLDPESRIIKLIMTATFLPSLKHMTLARTAITICKNPEVGCFINELYYLEYKNARESSWKRLMDKATTKVSELHVPPRLQQSILTLIKPISLEMAKNITIKSTMTASFVPSLKHMILARTAVTICEDPEVRCFINELDYLWDKSSGKSRWKRLMDKAKEKVSEIPVPPPLHQCILALIKPISLEMARWKYDHFKILGDNFDFQSCRLFWMPEGIIDRQKTAREINSRWKYMHRKTLFHGIFWFARLQKDGVTYWSELVHKLVNHLYPSTFCNYQKNPLWLRYFFDKLTSKEKKQCIEFTVNNTFKDHDNFRFCISQLNEEQREAVFKENPLRLLRFLLDWPYQSLFSEAAEQMWKYLQKRDFRYLLHFIIYNRIVADWYDFDYINLIKDFWHQSPTHFKDYIRNDLIYEPLKMVISHDLTKRFPKVEIIQTSFYVDPPNEKFSLLREGDFFHTR